MNEIRIPDDVFAALVDRLAEAALEPCPTGAPVNKDAIMIALAEVASIIPASLPPIDAKTDAAWSEMDAEAFEPISLDAYLDDHGLLRPDIERELAAIPQEVIVELMSELDKAVGRTPSGITPYDPQALADDLESVGRHAA